VYREDGSESREQLHLLGDEVNDLHFVFAKEMKRDDMNLFLRVRRGKTPAVLRINNIKPRFLMKIHYYSCHSMSRVRERENFQGDTVKAPNFAPHGNFGPFLARSIACLGEFLCQK
jgi:hypothetical protein